jgi:hypothetical protein
MSIIPITISLVILALSVAYRQTAEPTQIQRKYGVVHVPKKQAPALTVLPTENPSPPTAPTPTHVTVREPSGPPKSVNFDSWVYPGASVVNDQHGVQSTSSDDPGRITKWYEDKIKSLSMQVSTFVRTNANGAVKNTLGASGRDENIHVEISKNSGSDMTSIVVTRQ